MAVQSDNTTVLHVPDNGFSPLRDAVLLSSPGLHERGHDHCHQNKNNDDGECFKGPHSADLRQASHLS